MSETLLVAARFAQFASTIALAGCLCFAAAIAPTRLLDAAWRRVAWAALPIIVVSGALWFIVQAAQMNSSTISDALRPELLSTVLWHTQFGPVFALRLGLCALLALALFWRTVPARWIALVLSALLLTSLAWAGHAVGEKGRD